MSTSSTRSSLAVRGLSVLRSVGGWVAISPEQTYVATSIRGLGPCKSTYCRAERRELPASNRTDTGPKWLPLVAAALAAVGLLASCASYPPTVDRQGVADRDQSGRALVDCQNQAGPVSPADMVRTLTVAGECGGPGTAVQEGSAGSAACRTSGGAARVASTAADSRERVSLAID